jgi:hypothetical protein
MSKANNLSYVFSLLVPNSIRVEWALTAGATSSSLVQMVTAIKSSITLTPRQLLMSLLVHNMKTILILNSSSQLLSS